MTTDGPIFLDEPLEGSSKKHIFYSAFQNGKLKVQLGDVVSVRQPDGQYFGLVLVLWQEGIRPKSRRQWAEILWLSAAKADESQELLITPVTSCVDISDILAVVSVSSKTKWQEEERHSRRSKAVKMTQYYCYRGYHEQAQMITPEFDWDDLRGNIAITDLDQFRDKVVKLITEHVKSKLSVKLRGKIKVQKKVVYATVESSDDGSDDSTSSTASEYESSNESETGFHRDRKRPFEFDHDDASVTDLPHTPSKKRTTDVLQRTPKTPRTAKFTTITTPGSKSYRVQAPLEVTPLPSRASSTRDLLLSPHQLARQSLHVAEVPLSLPCREEEFTMILEQIESAVLENESALIYISGTPGTGKTATVREVIAALRQKVADEELFPFKFVEINGMKIPDPAQAYSKLWETLTGQRVTSSHALQLLQAQFKARNPSRMPCVVLMDELDQLTTTKQEVMYNFFQWPNMPDTKLIVIAVANTMDLPERTLAHKVSSRLGLSRIAFSAYTRPQLNEIIKSRLSQVDGIEVDSDAIDYACVRVSRVSGDARRALDICRRAFELAEPSELNQPGRITMKVMQKAFQEMTQSPIQLSLINLPFAAKILLKAIIGCCRRTGLTESQMGDVIDDAARICRVNTNPELKLIMGHLEPFAIMKVARNLDGAGIIYLEQSESVRRARVRLKAPEQEIQASWAEDPELSQIS